MLVLSSETSARASYSWKEVPLVLVMWWNWQQSEPSSASRKVTFGFTLAVATLPDGHMSQSITSKSRWKNVRYFKLKVAFRRLNNYHVDNGPFNGGMLRLWSDLKANMGNVFWPHWRRHHERVPCHDESFLCVPYTILQDALHHCRGTRPQLQHDQRRQPEHAYAHNRDYSNLVSSAHDRHTTPSKYPVYWFPCKYWCQRTTDVQVLASIEVINICQQLPRATSVAIPSRLLEWLIF